MNPPARALLLLKLTACAKTVVPAADDASPPFDARAPEDQNS